MVKGIKMDLLSYLSSIKDKHELFIKTRHLLKVCPKDSLPYSLVKFFDKEIPFWSFGDLDSLIRDLSFNRSDVHQGDIKYNYRSACLYQSILGNLN